MQPSTASIWRICFWLNTSLVATLAWAAGCSSSEAPYSDARARHGCNPLESGTLPIALANILGAGKHADGTVYVLDDGAPEYRAFVSQGSVLLRKIVSGSGTSPESIVANVEDKATPFVLKIELAGGKPWRMGVFRGTLDGKDFAIGESGSDSLELLARDALSAFTVRNVDPKVVVEYDASTSEGHRLIVIRPEVDWGYEDFRVFYGPADDLLERKLIRVSRGSSTFIVFEATGGEWTAFFPSQLSPNAGPAKITTASGSEIPLTVASGDAGVPGAELVFKCL